MAHLPRDPPPGEGVSLQRPRGCFLLCLLFTEYTYKYINFLLEVLILAQMRSHPAALSVGLTSFPKPSEYSVPTRRVSLDVCPGKAAVLLIPRKLRDTSVLGSFQALEICSSSVTSAIACALEALLERDR